MRPDSVPDLGAIQIIYLPTYLLTYDKIYLIGLSQDSVKTLVTIIVGYIIS